MTAFAAILTIPVYICGLCDKNLPREFLVFFVHSLGNVTKICYNTFNAPVSVTDANGIVTKYAYNDAGLVTRMERLDGSETLTSLSVAYDGSVVGIWNPLGGAVIAITAAGFRDVIRALDGKYCYNGRARWLDV